MLILLLSCVLYGSQAVSDLFSFSKSTIFVDPFVTLVTVRRCLFYVAALTCAGGKALVIGPGNMTGF